MKTTWLRFFVHTILISFFVACGGDDNEDDMPMPSTPEAPTADFTFSPDDPQVGQTVQFTSTTTNTDAVAWDFGDGTTSSTANPTHTYTDAGSYTVTLTATGEGGSVSAERSVSVSEAPADAPTADFTFSPDSPETGQAVQFTSTTTNANSLSWDFGDGTSSTDANPTHVYDNEGSYTVTLTATGDGGTATAERTIAVAAPPADAPTADFTFSPDSPETGQTVQFTSTTTNANSLSWDFGDGTSSTDANPTHVYDNEGSYTVTLTATGDGGTVTAERTISVQAASTGGGSGDVCEEENPCNLQPCFPVELVTVNNTSGATTEVRSVFEYVVVNGKKVVSRLTNTTSTPAGSIVVTSEYTYDERARNTTITSTTNSPFAPVDVVLTTEKTYNDCNLIREDSFDENGSLTGYTLYSYDGQGNNTLTESFDASGTLTGYTEFSNFVAPKLFGLQEAFDASGSLQTSTTLTYDNCQPVGLVSVNANGDTIMEQTGTLNAQGFLGRIVGTIVASEGGVTFTTTFETNYTYQCD
ncbi:MAG: PKD domain-containing protein [Bacteroidota bacterium]